MYQLCTSAAVNTGEHRGVTVTRKPAVSRPIAALPGTATAFGPSYPIVPDVGRLISVRGAPTMPATRGGDDPTPATGVARQLDGTTGVSV
jgi:hypothetical protein